MKIKQNCDLIDLVKRLKQEERTFQLKDIRDKIFGCCYNEIDAAIRSSLNFYQLPYQATEAYYENIFIDIYSRVFELEKLKKKIATFDFSKPFLPWLDRVIRNEVRDWMRKVDADTGLKNIEIIKEQYQIEMDNRPGTEGNTACDCMTSDDSNDWFAELKSGETYEKCFNEAINTLPMDQRAVVYLSLLAYQEIPFNVISYISENTDKSPDEIETTLTVLQKSLRESKKYKENRKKIKSLYKLYLRSKHYEKELDDLRKELDVLGEKNIKFLEDVAESIAYKGKIQQIVDEKRNEVSRLCKESGKNCVNALLELKKSLFIQKMVHWRINSKKRLSILSDFSAGKLYIRPGSKEIGVILGTSHQTIDTRRSRAKAAMGKYFRNCIQDR